MSLISVMPEYVHVFDCHTAIHVHGDEAVGDCTSSIFCNLQVNCFEVISLMMACHQI